MRPELALELAVALPFAVGVLLLLLPRRLSALTKFLAVATTALVFWATISLYRTCLPVGKLDLLSAPGWAGGWAGHVLLGLDGLSALILLGSGFFSLLMAVYSVGFCSDKEVSPSFYYANFLWVVAAVCATVLARDLLVLTFFWALMGIPFFLLINVSPSADAAAKKTLIVLGGSDSLLILGVALIFHLTGSFDLLQPSVPLAGVGLLACLCLAAAAFAKAGAMPFHSWVPDAAESAPVPVVALLPASLDKLLGIYLFARVSLGLFAISPGLRLLFVLVGAVTVMAAAMAALVQHKLRRLLGFEAVSQSGYMILGIATGTAIGVIGGLFHMVNYAICKSCLFLTAGAAERRSGTGELDGMGGLARQMPLTFVSAVVAAMALSGLPPLSGFTSKWMVYQGIIEMGRTAGTVWIVALVAAMFGSALTVAIFVKMLHSVFMGQPSEQTASAGPAPNALMSVPVAMLAVLCVIFGIFAYSVPVSYLQRAVPEARIDFASASWQPVVAAILLGAALVVGGIIYLLGMTARVREDDAYVGGEAGVRAERFRFSGVEFYRTISELPVLRSLYRHAEAGWYDLYHVGRRLVFYIASLLQAFHSGVLLTYVAWCVMGLVILLWLFVR